MRTVQLQMPAVGLRAQQHFTLYMQVLTGMVRHMYAGGSERGESSAGELITLSNAAH